MCHQKKEPGASFSSFGNRRRMIARSRSPARPATIAQVRHDVIGGGPLKYRREADGSYALYSIGWNMKDDGGEAAFNKEGAVDIQNGDWIWRCRVKAG